MVQKHAASRLHYDLRLELDGVLKSSAVPKGPSYATSDKRLAVHTEDHPLEYVDFEGVIPQSEYGGGTMMLWDRGTYTPMGDGEAGYQEGDFKFELHGERLHSRWVLVRMTGKAGDGVKHWLLIKERDIAAKTGEDAHTYLDEQDTSVLTHRSMDEIAKGKPADPVELDVAGIDGAKEATLPDRFEPQLATLAKATPTSDR